MELNELLAADKENIWHPFTPLEGGDPPLVITSAKGVYLHTHDGRAIIDGVSSWWVNLHGHSNPYIADALAKQAHTLEHVIFAGFTHEPAIKLSTNLLSILPDNQKKIFFSDNGSTAVEVAIKIALQHWHNQGIKKQKIIAIRGAYHGDTFGSMSVGERSIFTTPFVNHLFQADFIEFPEEGESEKTFTQLKELANRDDVAAFIYEPLIQGASGMRIYDKEILDRMIAYAKQQNIVCIADEVFTGFGRTGKYFASDHLENKPDIMALSKGLTGGTLPLGVTSVSQNVVTAFETSDLYKTFFHGHSYTANPLACAAANKSFEILISQACQANIHSIAAQQKNFAYKMNGHRNINKIKSLGTILSIEIKTPGENSYANSARKKIYDYFLQQNILLRPLGNTIYIVPPYVITEEQLSGIHTAIKKFLDNF